MEKYLVTEIYPTDECPDAFFAKEELVTREARRKYHQESEKVNEDLSRINEEFLLELFNPENKESYQSIYLTHYYWWVELVKWFAYHGNLEYVKINYDWFKNNYQPKENPTDQLWDC